MLFLIIVPKALKENPKRFSTSYIGVWGIPKRFKGVKGWVSGIGYEGKSWVPFILSLNVERRIILERKKVVGLNPTK